jgi:hypothetical protein
MNTSLLNAWELKGVCYDANWEDTSAWYGTLKSERQLKHLTEMGVNAVSFTPFANQPDVNRPEIDYRSSFDDGMAKDILTAKRLGMKVVLKPHIWSKQFWHGNNAWAGTIEMTSEADWKSWFEAYTEMICHFAAVAQKLRVDMFVIGVEYEKTIKGRTRNWRRVISSVRAIYKGPITYAAHGMEEADKIQFWDALDAIGVNAYFSLSARSNPSEEQLKQSWALYRTDLAILSRRNNNKDILLTEVGYSSVAGTAQKPFQWFGANSQRNEREQANCYEALFSTLKDVPWLRGLFLWKFKISVTPPEFSREPSEAYFVFQDKPAQKVVENYFK